MTKLIKDNKVAVLISPRYGAAFSCRNANKAMDGEIASLVYQNKMDEVLELAEKKYPDDYHGSCSDLRIVWVPIGTKFIIKEYDGSESLQLLKNLDYFTA